MLNWKNCKTYNVAFKQVVSIGSVIMLACLLGFFSAQTMWIIFFAFLIIQMPSTAPIRQTMLCLAGIVLALGLAVICKTFIKTFLWSYFILAILFLCCHAYLFFYAPSKNKILCTIIFFIVLAVAMLVPSVTAMNLPNLFIALMLSTTLVLIFRYLVLPVNIIDEFTFGIIPILESMNNFMSLLANYNPNKNNTDLFLEKNKIEQLLSSELTAYPEWVFELGFNRELRSGWRYFLIYLERTTEILFAMQFIIMQEKEIEQVNALQYDIQNSMEKNQELLAILIGYFRKNALPEQMPDFTADISVLEKNLQQILPSNLDLLDISPSYILLVALVKYIKDLREILLQLILTLPSSSPERRLS